MTTNPTCNVCKNKSKLVVFTSFQYYYCETCKDEVKDGSTASGGAWVRKGEIGICETCSMPLVEAIETIESAPSLWTDADTESKFISLQNPAPKPSIYTCRKCVSGWSPLLTPLTKMGCSKWDFNFNTRVIFIKGRGWV